MWRRVWMRRLRGAWQNLNFDKEYLFGFETLVFATSGILSLHNQLVNTPKRKQNLKSQNMTPLKYELHIILYETASFIQTAHISGFTGYIKIWGMFERSGQILILQSTCKANYINIHSFVLFKIHDIQAFTNPQASTCDPPCLRHITQVKLSAHSSGWAWEPASSLAGARSPLAAGGSWGAVPGRGGMMNNRCFLIGCAIRHTPASPQLQRAQQYVTVTGRMAPMHHLISATLSSPDPSAFIESYFSSQR